MDVTLEDQITPLPDLSRQRSTRRSRSQSIISVHTESEIHALAEFMSSFADTPKPSDGVRSNEDSNTELYPRVRSNTVSSLDSAHHSVASVLTTTPSYSDSDHQQSSDGHAERHDLLTATSSYHIRPRPPRIYTDTMHKSTPSLTSSASYSSLSTGRYTSPITPITSSSELLASSDLAIIDERHSDDAESPQNLTTQGPFAYTPQETLVATWPQQKSNIIWTATRTVAPTDPTSLASTFEAEMSPVSPQLPPTPLSAGVATFSRFLSRTRKQSNADQETQAQAAEEKRIRKEEARAKKEKARLEKLKRDLGVHPIVMGGMMALG
jgi:hypothetical protein